MIFTFLFYVGSLMFNFFSSVEGHFRTLNTLSHPSNDIPFFPCLERRIGLLQGALQPLCNKEFLVSRVGISFSRIFRL